MEREWKTKKKAEEEEEGEEDGRRRKTEQFVNRKRVGTVVCHWTLTFRPNWGSENRKKCQVTSCSLASDNLFHILTISVCRQLGKMRPGLIVPVHRHYFRRIIVSHNSVCHPLMIIWMFFVSLFTMEITYSSIHHQCYRTTSLFHRLMMYQTVPPSRLVWVNIWLTVLDRANKT